MRFSVKNQLGEAVVGRIGNRAAGSCPGELGALDLAVFTLGLIFGHADPGHFGVGVGDTGDHRGVEA